MSSLSSFPPDTLVTVEGLTRLYDLLSGRMTPSTRLPRFVGCGCQPDSLVVPVGVDAGDYRSGDLCRPFLQSAMELGDSVTLPVVAISESRTAVRVFRSAWCVLHVVRPPV